MKYMYYFISLLPNFELGMNLSFKKYSIFGLLLYVQLVLLCFNFPLFDVRELVLYAVWLPILYVPVFLFPNKWLYRAVVLIALAPISINFLHILITARPFTVSSFFIFTNSNFDEILEYSDVVIWWRSLLFLPFFVLAYWSMKYVVLLKKTKRNVFAYLGVLLVAGIFIAENAINERLVRKGVCNEARVWLSVKEELSKYQELKTRNPVVLDCTFKNKELDNEIVILVIGESLNRNHMQLYGYLRATNPLLSQRNDLIQFEDMISKHTTTLANFVGFYTVESVMNKEPNSVTMTDVFNSAGYETYWISNQSPIGIWDNAISNIAQVSKHKYFVNQTGNSSFETLTCKSYDEQILPIFEKYLGNQNKQFFVLHLLGNHTKYAYRYPSSFVFFEDASSSEELTIDEYDNAVRYNDFIINNIIETIQEKGKSMDNTRIVMLYLSDHGENVYDFEGQMGHNYENVIPQCLVEVPYLIWTNDDSLKLNLERVKAKPAMSSDLMHQVLGLSNINVSIYDSSKDVNSMYYNIPSQRILENGQIYERK